MLHEKACARPWHLPSDFGINADPRSRLFDPSDPNDPMLPHPGPHLYCYQLPQLSEPQVASPDGIEPIPPPPLESPSEALTSLARTGDQTSHLIQLVSAATDPSGLSPLAPDQEGRGVQVDGSTDSDPPYAEKDESLTFQAIRPAYWDGLPAACRSRMLEFESVRKEYDDTREANRLQREEYQESPEGPMPAEVAPAETFRDPARKLTFNDIVELAYLNSREYQAQKETLYLAALALTLERYDYMCKFSAGGNGVDVNYDHLRNNGFTTDTLAIPSSLQADRMVALGGTFVTRFANNVVLTFNGPQGFAEDISSNLLFDITQSVFQRDILLEPLIRTERNVVYAARNFARFRKQFFLNLARTYYLNLLGPYRQIEINSQNYFALVRALDQAEAEERWAVSDAKSRVQIDQIEQDVLVGQSSLINSCNSLERNLDQLKLTIGLPTETPVNIDLRELEALTLRDEVEVSRERVRRARKQVDQRLGRGISDRETALGGTIAMLERIQDWQKLSWEAAGQEGADEWNLSVLRARLRVDEAYEALDREREELLLLRQSDPPAAPVNVFRAVMNSVQARIELVARQLQLADKMGGSPQCRDSVLDSYLRVSERNEGILERVSRVLMGEAQVDISELQVEAEDNLRELEASGIPARRMVGLPDRRADYNTELEETLRVAQQVMGMADELTSDSEAGLASVDLSADDAMVTALVQRFELMNERGFLADDWRSIKLAADDLKSALNLNVRQSFQTRNNRPFDFDFDDSRTELSASLDLPLNRRQQRNGFRRSLINYQAGRRSLMALEDNVKFDVREDLRQLDLDGVQYKIAIISSALAQGRVTGTQLEFALGFGNASARDFLEAQNAYQRSLSAVANRRLGYIINRAQLALDLELLILDDAGLWPELSNEDYQPNFDPIYPFDADPTYGELPHGVWPSKRIKRMLYVPPPGYEVIGVVQPVDGDGESDIEDAEAEGEPLPAPAE